MRKQIPKTTKRIPFAPALYRSYTCFLIKKSQISLTCLHVAWSAKFFDNSEMVSFFMLPQCGMCTFRHFSIVVSEVLATLLKVVLIVVNNYVNFQDLL